MADEEHLARLRAGVSVWNAWREEHPHIVPDLSEANLSRANLRGANLSRVNLSLAMLEEADLSGTALSGSYLSHANLRGANLSKADLSDANLFKANLNAANLSAANLSAANLSAANLSEALLSAALLSDANLSGADLGAANLSEADLRGADLDAADLRGADLSNVDLSRANLREVDLSLAHLVGARLSNVDLGGADLNGADLRQADLSEADLRGANLVGAGLHDAHLIGADLSEASLFKANLSGADLNGADLRQGMLIDSRFDGANLTGARLWETQRGGWSIKGVICQRVFWYRDGNESTEYGAGDFERIFAEKPRIVLRYLGGISPVDLAMLPLIVERLQAEHPDCALHIRSVQDDGSGATVAITIDDLAGRSAEAFAQDIEVLRQDFAAIQQRLQREERLRLEFECRYKAVIQDIVPMLLERTQPNEFNIGQYVGQITGPNIIEGTAMSRNTYNISGQAGAVGPHSHAHDMTFQQIQNNLDLPKLAEELGRLRAAMEQENQGTREQDKAIAEVAKAEEAAIRGDGQTVFQHLKAVGKWTLGIAKEIGVPLAVETLKRMIGPT